MFFYNDFTFTLYKRNTILINKIMISIFFLCLLRYVLTEGIIWQPNDILELVVDNPRKYDPRLLNCYLIETKELYLNDTLMNGIYDMMELIKQKFNFTTIITIVDQRNNTFKADQFAIEVKNLLASNFSFPESNTISILFSMDTNETAIMGGSNVAQNFTSYDFNNYTNLIIPDLKEGNYGEAFLNLLGFIKDKEYKEIVIEIDDDTALVIIIIVVVVLVVAATGGLIFKKKSNTNIDESSGDKEMKLTVGATGKW